MTQAWSSPHSQYMRNNIVFIVNNMESLTPPSPATYADVVRKEKDVLQYQVEEEHIAQEIALKQSMTKVYF